MNKGKTCSYLSLFSGIGAFECAVRDNAYYKCVGYSEVESNALKVYRSHYPDHRYLGDVRAIADDTVRLLKPDLIVGGFPCTDLSSIKAVRTTKESRGFTAGGQSALFIELVRIIKVALEVNSTLNVIIENVASMSKAHRVYITSVLTHIFDGKSRIHLNCICASHFSIQRRKRLFWTTFPLEEVEDDLSVSTLTKPPFFKDIVKYDRLKEYMYASASTYENANKLTRHSKGRHHTRKSITLPTFVKKKKNADLDGTNDWYHILNKTFKLGRHQSPYNRLRHHLVFKTSRQPKTRTIRSSGASHYIIQYKEKTKPSSGVDLLKVRIMTRDELHACFTFPDNYCNAVSTYTKLVNVLGNSIVVDVLKFIIAAHEKQ